MAYNKQYIPQAQENGTILISEDVVASIVSQALKEVKGVVGLSARSMNDDIDRENKIKWNRGHRNNK